MRTRSDFGQDPFVRYWNRSNDRNPNKTFGFQQKFLSEIRRLLLTCTLYYKRRNSNVWTNPTNRTFEIRTIYNRTIDRSVIGVVWNPNVWFSDVDCTSIAVLSNLVNQRYFVSQQGISICTVIISKGKRFTFLMIFCTTNTTLYLHFCTLFL